MDLGILDQILTPSSSCRFGGTVLSGYEVKYSFDSGDQFFLEKKYLSLDSKKAKKSRMANRFNV